LPWIDVRHPEAAKTDNPSQNQPTLEYYAQYYGATIGEKKTIQDILDDSERLHLLQKMINLRQGKGTRYFDQIPLRAMGPAYFNEYQSRRDYYDEWLKEHLGREGKLPPTPEERHQALLKLRQGAYQKLCDSVYKAKGYNLEAVPLRETLEKFELLDDKADALLRAYGV
jgi:aldehyde:ferredoxin oxidoreductase